MDKLFRLILIAFFLLAGLKIIFTFFVVSPTIFADEYFYTKMAQSYFNFREFSVHGDFFQTYPPLYSVLISAAYYFKDMVNIYTAIKVINATVSSLIIFPVFFLAKELLTEKKAFLAAILISILPANIIMSGYVLSENLFYFLFLLSVFLIYKSFKEDNMLWDAFAGICVGLTILTKYLGVVLFVPIGVLFFYNLINKKNVTPKLILITLAGLIVSAWLFRNGYLFGFTLPGLIGSYARTGYPDTFSPLSLLIWVVIYFGSLTAATGFIFVTALVSNIKDNYSKNKIFYLLFIPLLAAIIFLLADKAAGSALFKADTLFNLTSRPIMRYVDAITPLVIIGGLANLANKKISKNTLIFLSVVMLFTSQIIFFQLFPANNASLIWLGAIALVLDNISINLYVISIISFAILALGIFIASVMMNNIKPNKLIALTIIFFIVLSLANMAAISINSNNWKTMDDSEVGLWINENIDGIILIDSKYCNEYDFRNIDTLCSKKNKSSLIGFWINDEIKIGNPNEVPANYIITRDILSLEKIYELDGTFIYKSA